MDLEMDDGTPAVGTRERLKQSRNCGQGRNASSRRMKEMENGNLEMNFSAYVTRGSCPLALVPMWQDHCSS